MQATLLNLLDPAPDFGLGLFLGKVHVEDGRKPFSQYMGEFGRSGMLEEASQDFAFFFVQVFGILAKGVETAVQGLIFYFGQSFLQTKQFFFAHLVGGMTIMLGNMETVCDDPGSTTRSA